MLPPDDEQALQTHVNLKELDTQEQRAREHFGLLLTEHPGTPWAVPAEYELGIGFGMIFAEGFPELRYAEVVESGDGPTSFELFKQLATSPGERAAKR